MPARFRATGINCTPKWMWVYYVDSQLVVPRRCAVQVPWGHVADVYRDLADNVNHEYARRMEAQAEAEQWALPGID